MDEPGPSNAEVAKSAEGSESFAPYVKGLHTLASAGGVTLIDAKRQHVSATTLVLDIRRRVEKTLRRP